MKRTMRLPLPANFGHRVVLDAEQIARKAHAAIGSANRAVKRGETWESGLQSYLGCCRCSGVYRDEDLAAVEAEARNRKAGAP